MNEHDQLINFIKNQQLCFAQATTAAHISA
jgi:hypothetical protein